MHWFEPYVFSFLLCKTKTVKKVSITDEIIAHLCIWIWMDLVGLVACLLRPRNRYLNQGEQWTYSGLSELWWHAASSSTQIQIKITWSLLRMEMLLWNNFQVGEIIAHLMNPASVQLIQLVSLQLMHDFVQLMHFWALLERVCFFALFFGTL